MLDKTAISDNFSRSAPQYDRHAVLQQAMAAGLLAKLPDIKPQNILDLGCGTGTLTRELAAKFPAARVVGLDLAPGMIEIANGRAGGNVAFRVGDGEVLEGEKEWDLVVANAALQWMDAAAVFARVARALKPHGLFAFTTFGPQTLLELRTGGFAVNRFLSAEELNLLAAPLFARAEIAAETRLSGFSSLKELLHYLKELGANTPEYRPRAELSAFRRFRERHPLVTATFEVITGLLFK